MTEYSTFVCEDCHQYRRPHQHAVICTACVDRMRAEIRGTTAELMSLDGINVRLRRQRDNHRKAKSKWKRKAETRKAGWDKIAELARLANDEQCARIRTQRERDEFRQQNAHLNECLSDLTTQVHEAHAQAREQREQKQELIRFLEAEGWRPEDFFRAARQLREGE